MFSYFVYSCLFFTFVNADVAQSKNTWVESLDEDNWDRMLTGEWMVEL